MEDKIYTGENEDRVLEEDTYRGYTYVIVTYGTHPCAYVEIPKDHPYYGIDYSEIFSVIYVHGGITYGGNLDRPGLFYLGWDYAHGCDYRVYSSFGFEHKGKKYTLEEIKRDIESVINQLIKIKEDRS